MKLPRSCVLAFALAGMMSTAVLAAKPDVVLVEFRSYTPHAHFTLDSGPEQPLLSAVRSEPEWKRLWSEIEPHLARESGRREPYPVPYIDFDSDTLIVAAAGMKSTGGWTLTIRSVLEFPARLLVSVIELRPGENCMASAVISHPIALALIPRTPKPVDFDLIRGETACE